MVNLLCCFVIFGLFSPLIALECLTREGTCKCHTNHGLIDLSPLDSTNGEPRFRIEHGHDVYTYNPCTPFSLPGCRNSLLCKAKTNHHDHDKMVRGKRSVHSAGWGRQGRQLPTSGSERQLHRIQLPTFQRSNHALDEHDWNQIMADLFFHDEPTSYSIGRARGYQWSGSDIWDIPPDSREHHDETDSETLFVNLMGNSPRSDVFRTSSVELICNHHVEYRFTLSDAHMSDSSETYRFALTTRYACPVDEHPGHNVTETPRPDHHPSETHPTQDPHPCPTVIPMPDIQLNNCVCLVDDQVAISKKTVIVSLVGFFVIVILSVVIAMYCTLLCVDKKQTSKKQLKPVKVYTIESDKKQLLA